MDLARTVLTSIVRKPRTITGTVFAIATLSLSAAAFAEVCPAPGSACPTGSSQQTVDFEAVAPGTSVEGLGAVHPDLAITSTLVVAGSCALGSGVGIEELNPVPPAYGTASGPNNCLNGIRGYGDDPLCVLNYEFTFSPGSSVSCFSIRMLDYGDFFPFGGVTHNVRIRGYAGVTLVDQQLLTIVGNTVANGDACVAIQGDPGNFILGVSGAGITRVTLEFDDFGDPNVGYDDIQFCLSRGSVPAAAAQWSHVKRAYRH